jgi:hypothetical protein
MTFFFRDMPGWFLEHSPLSMDALKGPDEQYCAGARDMLFVIQHTPESNWVAILKPDRANEDDNDEDPLPPTHVATRSYDISYIGWQ